MSIYKSRLQTIVASLVAVVISTTSVASPVFALSATKHDPEAYAKAKILYHALASCTTRTGQAEISADNAKAGKLFNLPLYSNGIMWGVVEGVWLSELTKSSDPERELCNPDGSVRLLNAAKAIWGLNSIIEIICDVNDPFKPGMLKPKDESQNCSTNTGLYMLNRESAVSYLRDTLLFPRFSDDGSTDETWSSLTDAQKYYLYLNTFISPNTICQKYLDIVETVSAGVENRKIVIGFNNDNAPIDRFVISNGASTFDYAMNEVREIRMFQDEYGGHDIYGLHDGNCIEFTRVLAPDSAQVKAVQYLLNLPGFSACVLEKKAALESERRHQVTLRDEAADETARNKAISEISRIDAEIASLLANPDEFCPPGEEPEPPEPPREMTIMDFLPYIIGGVVVVGIIIFILIKIKKTKKSSELVIRSDAALAKLGRAARVARKISHGEVGSPRPDHEIPEAEPMPTLMPKFLAAITSNNVTNIQSLTESGDYTHGEAFATEVGKAVRILTRTPGALPGIQSLADFCNSKDGHPFLLRLRSVAPDVYNYLVVMEIESLKKKAAAEEAAKRAAEEAAKVKAATEVANAAAAPAPESTPPPPAA